ncbi:MAG: tape measure protein, partial [Lachnospiraceae bacterium]|nr:tape measure protein [Lachnospiraceae bacterium]
MAKQFTFQDKFDERILSMSFDNADFERNMAQTMDTLETFDQSLNKLDATSFDGITKAAKKVDLSGIASAAYAVERSFSAMEIVGLTVIQNLTNAAINFGRGLWANTFGQIKTGGLKRALNIEQASFLLEGLKLDVKQIKEDAMYAVEGTAYGFDEAAKAAASFGASGVKAGDDMKQALLGVSGVAAMTGQDYQRISEIFTTIASNGRLMTEQLRSFSYAGLNISAVLGEQLGKTEAEINDMVTKGKISFETFSKAMSDAFGEHAKDANKTFSGAMSNMKAALSRVGEAFATPYIENMIPVFNKLRDVINQLKTDLAPFIYDFELISKILSTVFTRSLDKILKTGAIEKVLLSFRNIITTIALLLNEVGKAFREVFPNSKGFLDSFYKFTKALIPSKEALEGFREVMKTIFVVLRMGAIIFGNVIKLIASLILYINKWVQELMVLAVEFKNFLDPFIKWVNETKLIE